MSKPQKFWNVKRNTTDAKAVDILIYGIIGQDWWTGEGTTASGFVSEFKALEKEYDRINIRINSPGGSIWEGLPIFNAISQSEKNVHTYCDGIAYSMGAIILLAGKQVHAAKNSLILLHSPLSWCGGNAKDMRDTADQLDIYGQSLMHSISDKTGMTIDDVKSKYFDYQDHLMSAQDALDSKLVDDIIGEEVKLPDGISNMTYKQVMNLYQNQGDQDGFIIKLASQMKQFFNFSPVNKHQSDIIMNNLEKFITALTLEATATVEDVLAAIEAQNQALTDLETANSTLQASLTEKTDALVIAESQLTAEVTAHAATKKEFKDFKAADAGEETRTGKEKDEIESGDDPSATFAHNRTADAVTK